ncbi:MAG: hypothetical protein QNJ47_05600 [Nostocaceae cyanobacterium]|nr:hypothetical protein [Nostocaceae cyanobacterium]
MVAATVLTRNQTDISNLADATNSIIEQAFWLASQKRVLSYQQYKYLLSSIGWSLKESRVYLKVAAAFSSFSPDELQEVEPNTIFELARHTKKYHTVIEKLKDCGKITQEKVREFITAHRTPKKPKPDKPSIWKLGRDGKPVCRIPDILEDDMQTGNIIQKEMDQNGTFAQTLIREAVTLWQAVKEGRLVVKDVEVTEESSESTSNDFEQQDFIIHSESENELGLNTFIDYNSNSDDILIQDEIEESINKEQVTGNKEQELSVMEDFNPHQDLPPIGEGLTSESNECASNLLSPPLPVDRSLFPLSQGVDVSQNQIPLEQIVKDLTQVNSWSEVISITNNYSQTIKSQIWELLSTEIKNRFQEMKRQYVDNFLQVNDRVMWEKCPGNLYLWQPFVITRIQDGKAMLDVFNRPVPLDELTKCRE